MKEVRCLKCGGDAFHHGFWRWKCRGCGFTWDEETVVTEQLWVMGYERMPGQEFSMVPEGLLAVFNGDVE